MFIKWLNDMICCSRRSINSRLFLTCVLWTTSSLVPKCSSITDWTCWASNSSCCRIRSICRENWNNTHIWFTHCEPKKTRIVDVYCNLIFYFHKCSTEGDFLCRATTVSWLINHVSNLLNLTSTPWPHLEKISHNFYSSKSGAFNFKVIVKGFKFQMYFWLPK